MKKNKLTGGTHPSVTQLDGWNPPISKIKSPKVKKEEENSEEREREIAADSPACRSPSVTEREIVVSPARRRFHLLAVAAFVVSPAHRQLPAFAFAPLLLLLRFVFEFLSIDRRKCLLYRWKISFFFSFFIVYGWLCLFWFGNLGVCFFLLFL